MDKEMTDAQAQRLVTWLLDHEFTREEANEALAFVMGVKEPKEKGSQKAGKQS